MCMGELYFTKTWDGFPRRGERIKEEEEGTDGMRLYGWHSMHAPPTLTGQPTSVCVCGRFYGRERESVNPRIEWKRQASVLRWMCRNIEIFYVCTMMCVHACMYVRVIEWMMNVCMCACVCMCTCARVCLSLWTFAKNRDVCMCVHTCIRIHPFTRMHARTYIHANTNNAHASMHARALHTGTYTHTHARTLIHAHAYIHERTRTYIHAHRHAHIHTCTQTHINPCTCIHT
jgi:hypothetical protein